MFRVKFDNKQINKILNNSVSYSYGFLEGVQMERLNFNRFLSGLTQEALGKYIDAQARMNTESLHHVYEPGMTGSENGRLFRFNVNATATNIRFEGSFLPSKGTPINGGDPFTNRAEIMENAIGITIAPKNSNVLAFEGQEGTVFTTKEIYIAHPGGDAVAGAFGETVSKFFDSYFTSAILKPIVEQISNADDFVKNFSAGTKSGKSVGVKAGRQYLKVMGEIQ